MSFKRIRGVTALLTAAVVSAALVAACGGGDEEEHATHDPSTPSASSAALQSAMRQLWEDHVAWTRLAIISLATDSPDTSATVTRLLRNQMAIGDAVKPFYGTAAGDALTALLTDHIKVAADLVLAAKAGNQTAVEAASTAWYANADEIAVFLSSANPDAWKAVEMKAMMREHLDLTLNEAVHYLQRDYAASIADYDEARAQVTHMADMLAAGIVTQFADRFALGSGN